MKQIDFEPITLKLKASHRGGGIIIDLTRFGNKYKFEKMSAYQNYLGGGLLGRISTDCTIRDWRNDKKLVAISDQLARYFHNITNHDYNEFESATFEQNQLMPFSAY